MFLTLQTEPALADGKAVFSVENDDSLVRLIALFLCNKLFGRSDEQRKLAKEMGWADSVMSVMGDMPIADMARLLTGPNACVGLVLDYRKASAMVHSYRAIKREESELDVFVTRGATLDLLKKLFPSVSARVISAARKRLGCDSKGGRPRLPDPETAHRIYRRWQEICADEQDVRRRYLRLANEFPDLTLPILCSAIEGR